MVNAAPSTVEISHPMTDPTSLVELSSCSLVEPSSRSMLEQFLLMEFATVVTQIDHIKKYSFLIFYRNPNLDLQMQTHLNDDFYIPTKPFCEYASQVYIVKLGIEPDRQYCP